MYIVHVVLRFKDISILKGHVLSTGKNHVNRMNADREF